MTTQYTDMLSFLEDDADNETLQTMLDGLEGKIEEKVENTVKIIKSLESDSAGIDAEIKRLTSRKAALINNVGYLKQNIETSLIKLGTDKIKGNLFTVSLQVNPHKVNVIDENLIPEYYFNVPEVKPCLDKKRLAEALKSGEYHGPAATLIQDKSLRIK
jgi:hypothetical protein